jgi:activator of HSP90 ATPase
VQSWRTSDFPEESEDSRLEILLEEAEGGTKLTLIHTQIPEGQGEEYRRGWEEFYFEPLSQYFSKQE